MKKFFYVFSRLCFCVPVLLSCAFSQADVIHLRNGDTLEGEITEYTDQHIKIDPGIGVTLTFYPEDILSLNYASLRKENPYRSKLSRPYHLSLIEWLNGTQNPITGFPVSFSVLPSKRKDVYSEMGEKDSVTAIIERMIVEEGVSVYDTAVYEIVLTMLGGPENLSKAYRPLAVYWEGKLGELRSLRAGGYPADPFVYSPDDKWAVSSDLSDKGKRGFLFRIFSAKGKYNTADPLDGKTKFNGFPNWPTVHWEDWKPIAGENAWVVMAALHLYHQKYYDEESGAYRDNKGIELPLAQELARAAMLLQADNGGIRMAPMGTFCNLLNIDNEAPLEKIQEQLDEFAQSQPSFSPNGLSDFSLDITSPLFTWYYNEISTENNISWFAAFRMLYAVTGENRYKEAQDKIINYFKSVWSKKENIFYQGAHWEEGAWKPNTEYFATDVQDWAVLALGPAALDAWFGPGTAYGIWNNTKVLSGEWDEPGNFFGVGFTKENDRICVEWTAGAIMAVKRLAEYYADIHPGWAESCLKDAEEMREGIEFLRHKISNEQEAFSYSSRRDWIPFGWFSHDPEVLSLVSTAWVLLMDADFNPFYLPKK